MEHAPDLLKHLKYACVNIPLHLQMDYREYGEVTEYL